MQTLMRLWPSNRVQQLEQALEQLTQRRESDQRAFRSYLDNIYTRIEALEKRMSDTVSRDEFDKALTAKGDELAGVVSTALAPITAKLTGLTNDPATPLDFTPEMTILNGIDDKIKAVFAPTPPTGTDAANGTTAAPATP